MYSPSIFIFDDKLSVWGGDIDLFKLYYDNNNCKWHAIMNIIANIDA